jgi:hypothetical protein
MAGYSDTRQLIIDTLMGRPAGTEIQPEDHQAFALALNDYIRSVELVAGSGVPVAFAEPDTVPVQPNNGQAVYLSQVPYNSSKTFSNFIGQDGNALSVSSAENVVKLVTLLWNGSYWSKQETSILQQVVDDLPIIPGDAEHSAVLKGEKTVAGVTYKNEALNEGCVSLGANSKAGLKGYYFTYIDFNTNQIWLHNQQFTSRTLGSLGGWKKNSVSDANRCGWAKGDVISFTCNGHYDNSATIVNVVDNVITVDKLPFTLDDVPSTIISIEEANNKFDECSVFCVKKFNIGTVDLGGNAFAIGTNTQASNAVAYTEGYNTIAYGKYSHAEGNETEAGYNAHAEGYKTKALGERSHAEGRENIAEGTCSHVEGRSNTSNGDYSHAEGYGNTADGWGSHVEGQNSKANGITSHAEGYMTIANGEQSHAEGRETKTSETAKYSHAEGYKTLTEGRYSHAEGGETTAIGNYSHAEGYNTTANGGASHAEGSSTEAGENAHSEGLRTKATGNNSHAEGQNTQATGTAAHAEGDSNLTEAVCSHIEGFSNEIYKNGADSSHAEGENNIVNNGAYASHVEGEYNRVNNRAEHASGRYNQSIKSSIATKATQFSIGIGTSDDDRKNALEVKKNGDIFIIGLGGYDGTNSDSAQPIQEVIASLLP